MRDKNGYRLQDGTPVRIVQTHADFLNSNRKYYLKELDGEMFLTIPLKEFKNGDSEFHAVESVR